MSDLTEEQWLSICYTAVSFVIASAQAHLRDPEDIETFCQWVREELEGDWNPQFARRKH